MSNVVLDKIKAALPAKRKHVSSGWQSMNCPCCLAMGEPRPDTKGRGGIIFTSNGGFSYHCFNCKIKVHWEPGSFFGNRLQMFTKCLGFSQEEIRKLKFKSWQMRGQIEMKVEVDHKPKWSKINFNEHPLPDGSKKFEEWVVEDNPPKGFVNAAEYLNMRSEFLLRAHTYYWTPSLKHDMNRRVIVPFYWKDKIVGHTGRLINGIPSKQSPRYYGHIPENFLFNNKVLYLRDRIYLILVEGVFDAIAVDGLGLLGSSVTEEQISWINSAGMEVIFLPDRDKASEEMIDVAIEQHWDVAFPEWEEDVDDAATAVGKYGRIFSIKSILESRESSRIAINVRRKRWCKE